MDPQRQSTTLHGSRLPHRRAVALLVLLTLAALLGSATVRAEGEQAYFTAMVGPLGSISSPGQAATGVYLRWDVVEGGFPGELDGFRLKRDGVVIYDVPAATVMSEAQINALYTGPENNRRLAELVRWLDELATDQDPPDPATGACGAPPATAANVACLLRARLQGDPYWAFLAARNDFNVARAYHRGFLDTGVPGPSHVYELVGVSTTAAEVRIGLVEVNVGSPHVLPKPVGFRQIEQFGRCDAPEKHKDHAAVVLNWAHGSFSPTPSAGDRYVSALLTTGFDLYRTTENVAAAVDRDLRQLAAAAVHDADGNVALAGLEKVNDQPIAISGHAETEQLGKGWHPPYFQYLRTGPDILAEGLKPGDRRAYYVVARDLTGNYGNTEKLLVEIPDAAAPPPPWALRTVIDPAADTFALQWDAVNVHNFAAAHQGRTYCNLATAVADRELRWVRAGEACASGFQVPVDLDVEAYLVYRFPGTEAAARFTDSDGDGRADVDERQVISVNPPLTDSGLACDASQFPVAAVDYRFSKVPATAVQTRASGRQVVEIPDATPTGPLNNKGDVFWYRIASVDSQGNIGPLSAPLRAHYPFRHKPGRCRDPLRVRECIYGVEVDRDSQPPLFAEDASRDAQSIAVSCAVNGLAKTIDFDLAEANGSHGVLLDADLCARLAADCDRTQMGIDYRSGSGQVLASADLGEVRTNRACSAVPRTRLTRNCEGTRSVNPGEMVTPGLLEFDCPTEADECLTLFREIGGQSYHYATNCPGLGPVPFDPSDWANVGGGEPICFSAAIHNQNNELSTKIRLPCFRFPTIAPPDPPQPLEIAFLTGTSGAELAWQPPQQHVTGSIAEWSRKGVDESGEPYLKTGFFEHAGQASADGPVRVSVPITAEPPGTTWEEEWCFRARSVGQGGPDVLSEWSLRRCALRLPATADLPEFIPWPKIDRPPQIDTALNRYLGGDGVPVVLLTESEIDLDCGPGNDGIREPPLCRDDKKDSCIESGANSAYEGVCANFCQQMKEAVAGKLGFVAYRQSTDDPAQPSHFGDYVQVSPFIDRVFCGTSYTAYPTTVQSHLDDPFIKWMNFVLNEPPWDGLRLVFQDATPHIAGMYYRYQLVYFGADGEILGSRQTDWIEAQ